MNLKTAIFVLPFTAIATHYRLMQRALTKTLSRHLYTKNGKSLN